MAGTHVKFNVSPEEFLGRLTMAAYEVLLKHGSNDVYMDVLLDLRNELHKVIEDNMVVCGRCGTTEACKHARRFDPFSVTAQSLFPKDELEE